MKILITGSEGQLGQELCRIFHEHELIPLNHKNGDITKLEIIQTIEKYAPGLVIHGAAYTDVDGCENAPDQAYRVNALGTRNVVLGSKRVGADLVYISTDYVFDGEKGSPYTEFDQTNPINVYGASKLAGESQVHHLTNRFYTVRSSWLYGLVGKNFVKTVLKMAKEQETLKIVNDQISSPTFVRDLAIAISKLVQTKMYGIYHAAASGSCTWFEFTKEILKVAGIQKQVIPITSRELKRQALRPAFSVLRGVGLEMLGIQLRRWEDGVRDCTKGLLGQ